MRGDTAVLGLVMLSPPWGIDITKWTLKYLFYWAYIEYIKPLPVVWS